MLVMIVPKLYRISEVKFTVVTLRPVSICSRAMLMIWSNSVSLSALELRSRLFFLILRPLNSFLELMKSSDALPEEEKVNECIFVLSEFK